MGTGRDFQHWGRIRGILSFSAERAVVFVLSKSSPAVRPTATNDSLNRDSFQRFKAPKERVLKLVPGEGAPAQTPDADQNAAQSTPHTGHTQLTSAVLELFELVQQGRSLLMRWLGMEAYRRSARTQRKAKLFRKGTMIDRRA